MVNQFCQEIIEADAHPQAIGQFRPWSDHFIHINGCADIGLFFQPGFWPAVPWAMMIYGKNSPMTSFCSIHLEAAPQPDPGLFARIGIMSSLNEELAGPRLGPYYLGARQKYGQRLYVRVIISTAFYFLNAEGQKSDYPEPDSVSFKETGTGILVRSADSPDYFPYLCESEDITDSSTADNDKPE